MMVLDDNNKEVWFENGLVTSTPLTNTDEQSEKLLKSLLGIPEKALFKISIAESNPNAKTYHIEYVVGLSRIHTKKITVLDCS